jgi:hypothetical protein
MTDDVIIKRMTFYLEWWKSLDEKQRHSRIPGEWVRERIARFTEALNDHLKDIPYCDSLKKSIAA